MNWFLMFVFFPLGQNIFAQNRATPTLCGNDCPNGTRDVALFITSRTPMTPVESNRQIFDRIFSPPPHLLRLDMSEVADVSKIREVLERQARACHRIKYLTLLMHSQNGGMVIGPRRFLSVFTLNSLMGMSCVMAPQAEIHLQGCNLGRGCRGEDFLQHVAHVLLRENGGQVFSPTFYANTVSAFTSEHGITGDRQILTVSPQARSFHWDNTPKTREECRSFLRPAIRQAAELRRQAPDCANREDILNQLNSNACLRTVESADQFQSNLPRDRNALSNAQNMVIWQSFVLAVECLQRNEIPFSNIRCIPHPGQPTGPGYLNDPHGLGSSGVGIDIDASSDIAD